jgi:alkanesulfonate monooxygenase SsuD/methylene tetrahydromethanopterin reductase-like flavin-dependent oxidoreductase (luciferase family)
VPRIGGVRLSTYEATGLERRREAAAQRARVHGEKTAEVVGVLELHGWDGLHEELNALSTKGAWVEMGYLVTDEILNTFAVVGEPEQIAPELLRRYSNIVQRISFYAPYKSAPDRWHSVLTALQQP